MELETQGFLLPFPGVKLNILGPGSVCLLTGPPGVGKSVFATTLSSHALRLGDRVMFVALDSSPDEVRRSVLSFFKGELNNRFFILDFFNRRPGDLTDVSIQINQAVRGSRDRIWLILDSLSTLGTVLKADLMPPWILDLRVKLKLPNVITFFLYTTGINPPALTANLQVICDGTLEMKVEEDPSGEVRRFFRVYSLRNAQHTTRWFNFDIGSEGLSFPFRE